MNLLGFLILTVVLYLVLTGSRRRALLGMMVGILYLTQSQQITLGGFNIFAFRIVELATFIRVLSRREFSFGQATRIDKALLTFVIYTVVVFILRWGDGIAYRIGWGTDAILSYFAFRGLIHSREDLHWFLRALLVLLIPYALLLLYESYARNNYFTLIGGRGSSMSLLREGRMRACGSFRHPSLTGTLGASFLPLYLALLSEHQFRKQAIIGILTCLGIVWASNSGGPLSAAAVAIVGWMFWKVRKQMRFIRWFSLVLLILLALMMKAPVWYLIARISTVTGGDGYHRSRLMEQGFNSLGQWGLAGMPIERTQHWFPYFLHTTGGADITNQYLAYGITSGLGAMLLFFWLLILAFKALGRALQDYRDRVEEPLIWGAGVVVFVHMFNWLGINYFDQFYAVWYCQLAAVVALTTTFPPAHPDGSPAPVNRPTAFNPTSYSHA